MVFSPQRIANGDLVFMRDIRICSARPMQRMPCTVAASDGEAYAAADRGRIGARAHRYDTRTHRVHFEEQGDE
jgi:hypothetical protein